MQKHGILNPVLEFPIHSKNYLLVPLLLGSGYLRRSFETQKKSSDDAHIWVPLKEKNFMVTEIWFQEIFKLPTENSCTRQPTDLS